MKKIITLLSIISLFFMACEGDPGPPGPPGPDGGLIVSDAFEIELDFTAENNYEFVEPYGFEVFPTDVTLVYIRWDVVDGQEVWRPLPQSVPFPDGDLIYNYDFTQTDVNFFLDGTTRFDTLDPVWTQSQVFRVVVIPAENVGRLDYNNLDAVIDFYNIQEFKKR